MYGTVSGVTYPGCVGGGSLCDINSNWFQRPLLTRFCVSEPADQPVTLQPCDRRKPVYQPTWPRLRRNIKSRRTRVIENCFPLGGRDRRRKGSRRVAFLGNSSSKQGFACVFTRSAYGYFSTLPCNTFHMQLYVLRGVLLKWKEDSLMTRWDYTRVGSISVNRQLIVNYYTNTSYFVTLVIYLFHCFTLCSDVLACWVQKCESSVITDRCRDWEK